MVSGASSGTGAIPGNDVASASGVASSGAGSAIRRRIDFQRRRDGRLEGWNRVVVGCALLAMLGSMGWMYFRQIGRNPAGFFSDEAEIGLRTWQLIHGTLPAPSPRFPLFYQHFDTIHLGSLPLYTTAPFEIAFGLSDWAVRLASVCWSALAIIALILLVRSLGLQNGWVGVAAFALSPTAIHIARITFGHAGSFAVMALGLYAYTVGRERRSTPRMILAGILLGISVYGYAAYYFATPLLMVTLTVGELITNGLGPRRWGRWRSWAIASLTCLVVWIPVVYRALTNPAFADRFRSKQESADITGGWSFDRVQAMLHEYPKYFSFDFLFRYGDNSGILRHTVVGAGLFPWIVLPLVILGAIAVIFHRRGTAKVIGIAALGTTILMPLPDLPTTAPNASPYAFSVYPMLIGVPILGAFAVAMLSRWIGGTQVRSIRQSLVPVTLTVAILLGAWSFYRGPYADYPNVSAGYYGWQFGPGPAIEFFVDHRDEYDRFYLNSDYNGALVFPPFYLADDPDMAARTALGSPHEFPVTGDRVLFAEKPERWALYVDSQSALRRYSKLVGIISYPDGTPALLLISISYQNPPAPSTNW